MSKEPIVSIGPSIVYKGDIIKCHPYDFKENLEALVISIDYTAGLIQLAFKDPSIIKNGTMYHFTNIKVLEILEYNLADIFNTIENELNIDND